MKQEVLTEETEIEKRENRFVFFLKSNGFLVLISAIIAVTISCVLILVVANKYMPITFGIGLIFISSVAIVLFFFIYVPIKYFVKRKN